ncbi:MAG: hypothetical protein M3P11_05370 [Actinomycetota bacterium]|nr:hypothetical protein [Actinomycetota bacterium]
MRRPTLIMLIVLCALLIGVAILQFSVDPPATRLPGPTRPGQLPSASTVGPTP